MSVQGKRILLVIGGGIAAYKTLELIRQLQKRGAGVRAILTDAGAQFVTPLSVASLTADKVYQNLFDLTQESEMGHIVLSRSADLVVVAPATADLIAKMAAGMANDLATTALIATDKRVLIAPAMESAIILLRTLTGLTQGLAAGLVLGARVPIVLPARRDTLEARMAACVLASLMSAATASAQPAAPGPTPDDDRRAGGRAIAA